MTISMNQLETYGLQATAILKEMDENFPPVQPTPYDNIEKIMYQAGQRSVVEWYKQQMEN